MQKWLWVTCDGRCRPGEGVHTLAYSCFMISGVLALVVFGALRLLNPDVAEALIFMFSVILAIVWLITTSLGIVLSIRLWRHSSLVFLSLASALFIAQFGTKALPASWLETSPLVYGLVSVGVSLPWFARAAGPRAKPT